MSHIDEGQESTGTTMPMAAFFVAHRHATQEPNSASRLIDAGQE